MTPIARITRPGRLALAAAATAALAVAAVLTITTTGQATPAPPGHHVTRIHLVEREVATQFVDVGKPGPSAGDRNVVVSDLLTPAGKTVGRADFDCALTGVGPHMGGVCTGALTLKGGQLIGQFAFGPSGSTRLQAITGGTGRFEGVRGQAIVSDGTDAHEPFVLELIR